MGVGLIRGLARLWGYVPLGGQRVPGRLGRGESVTGFQEVCEKWGSERKGACVKSHETLFESEPT
jgi:hypothetical protein